MAIKIPFVADTSDFLRGTRDLEQGLDGVADALDEISRAGDQVDTEVGADLTSVGKEADQAAEKVETSFREAFRAVEAQGRTSTRKVRADVDEVGHKGSQTMREFSDEAKQNVAESVSSFTGSAESGVDAIQSTFGGLVSALGPAGVVGAALAAAGIGLARGLFTKAQESAEELSERVADLTGTLIDAGRGTIGFQQIGAELEKLATTATVTGKSITDWAGEPSTRLLDLQRNAELAGLSFGDLALGLSGNSDALNRSLGAVNDRLAEIKRLTTPSGGDRTQLAMSDAQAKAYEDETNALLDSRKALEAKRTEVDASTRAVEAYEEAQRRNVDLEAEVTRIARTSVPAQSAAAAAAYTHGDAAEIQAAANKDAAAAIRDKNRQLRAEAVDALAASNAAIAYEQAVDDATAAVKENGKSHDLNTEKGRANQAALNNLAGTLVALAEARQKDTGKVGAYNHVINQNRDEFIKAARAAGYTKDAAEDLADAYGLVPKTVKTDVTDQGTAKDTQRKIDNIKGKDVSVDVSADMSGVDREIKNYFDGKVYNFTVAPRPGKSVAS